MQSWFRTLIAIVLVAAMLAVVVLVLRSTIQRRRAHGAIIAFVGPDASGKTTLVSRLTARLSSEYRVWTAQFSWIPEGRLATRPLRTIILAARKLVRIVKRDLTWNGVEDRYPGFQSMLDVCAAFDVWLLAAWCRLARAMGSIVVTDRYPNTRPGAANGPLPLRASSLTARLAFRLQCAIYRVIPPPDLVLRLNAPLDLRLGRNAMRGQRRKDDQLIRTSHAATTLAEFPGTSQIPIDTTRPIPDTENDVDGAVRSFLENLEQRQVDYGRV